MPNLGPVPANTVLLSASDAITSGNYAFTAPIFLGTRNQSAFLVSVTIGAGVTSAEIKVQSGLTATGTFYDWPHFDETNGTTIAGEFVVDVLPYVFSFTTDGNIGPLNVPGTIPYVRLAYKISGEGTVNIEANGLFAVV